MVSARAHECGLGNAARGLWHGTHGTSIRLLLRRWRLGHCVKNRQRTRAQGDARAPTASDSRDTPARSGVPPPPHAVALIIIRLQVHHEECIQKITSPVRAAKHPHDTCNGRVTTQKQPPPITSSTGSSIQSLATRHDPGIPELSMGGRRVKAIGEIAIFTHPRAAPQMLFVLGRLRPPTISCTFSPGGRDRRSFSALARSCTTYV